MGVVGLYESQYGLRTAPFRETVDPSAYLALPSRESALRRLRFGLERGGGPVLAFGPSGVGKSILARKLGQLPGWRSHVCTFPALPAADLLSELAESFAIDGIGRWVGPRSTGQGASLRRVRDALAESARRGVRRLLIVDDAHLISDPETFEALRLLLNYAEDGTPDLGLVLVAATELVVRMPVEIEGRLAARVLIGALDLEESASYLEGRLRSAGAVSTLFDPEASTLLASLSEGVPRRLNRLADLSLVIAHARRQPRADAEIVALAARELALDGLAA